MKKNIKNSIINNIAIIVAFLILFIFFNISALKVYIDNEIRKNDMDNSINWCNKLLEYEPDNFCKNNIDEYYTKDTLSIYYDIFNSSKYSTLFYFSIPFLVIASSLYMTSKKFRNQDIKNCLTRESYNKYIKKIFKDAYKSVIIWPLLTIYLLIISYLISGTFEVSITPNIASFPMSFLKNPSLFIISYLLNTIFMSFFWTNIALLIVPDTRNYIVSVLESIMIYFGIALTNTFFVILLISKIFHRDVEKYLDFFDVYNYYNRELIPFNILCLSIALISGLLVYLKYKNKEKIIMKLERNS